MESGDNALLSRTHRLVLSEQSESNGFLHSLASGFAQGASPRQVAHSVGMTRRAASSDPMAQFRTRRRLLRRIRPHLKEEAMSRPRATVRRVGRRPTANPKSEIQQEGGGKFLIPNS
jgi:hypothetical protein